MGNVSVAQGMELGRQLAVFLSAAGVQDPEVQALIERGLDGEVMDRLLDPLKQYLLRPAGGHVQFFCNNLTEDKSLDSRQCLREDFTPNFNVDTAITMYVAQPPNRAVHRAIFDRPYLVTSCLDQVLGRSTAPGMETIERFLRDNLLYFTPREAHELFKRVSATEMMMLPIICPNQRIRLLTRGSGRSPQHLRIENLVGAKMAGRILYFRKP